MIIVQTIADQWCSAGTPNATNTHLQRARFTMELRRNKENSKLYVTIPDPPKRLLNFYANLRHTDKTDPTYQSERLPDDALQASLRRYIREQPEYKSLRAGKLPPVSAKGLPVKVWKQTNVESRKAFEEVSVARQPRLRRPSLVTSAPINAAVVANNAFHKIKFPEASDKHVRFKDHCEASSRQHSAPPHVSSVETAPQPRAQCSFANTGLGLGRVYLQMDDVISGDDSRVLSMTYSSSVLNTNPKVLTDDIVRLSLKREVARDFIVGRIENRLAGIRKKRTAYEEMLRKKSEMRGQADQTGRRDEGRVRPMYRPLLDMDKKLSNRLLPISEQQNVHQGDIRNKTLAMRRPVLRVLVKVGKTYGHVEMKPVRMTAKLSNTGA